MKTFLINLKKDSEKLAVADAQLRRMGIAYERVEGVYGKELSSAERKRVFSPFRWWCAVGRPCADAEIGCALSHFSIYRRMIKEDLPFACVLEDDVVLDDRWNEVLPMVERQLSVASGMVVLLSDHTSIYRDEEFDQPKLMQSSGGTCAEGYVITQAAARALLSLNFPILVPCDTWGRWTRMGKIELYHALPTVCRQNQAQFGSSTSQGRFVVSELPVLKFIWHKMKRTVGKAADMMLIRLTGR